MKKKPENQDKKRNSDGTFPKGISGNPAGRPKGKTIKERVREWLEDHPDDMQSFVDYFVKNNRDLAWQMLEGRPSQALTGNDGKDLIPENTAELQEISSKFNEFIKIQHKGH